jgi:hypothetical protein
MQKKIGALDNALQQRLGKKLRKIFSDVGAEPLPPRFAKLLGDDDPTPFGGANGARPPVEKKKVNAARRYDGRA